jgi:transposase
MQATIQHNSTHFAISRLKPNQVLAAIAIAEGQNVRAAARHAGVVPATIYYWIHKKPGFKVAIYSAFRRVDRNYE